MSNQKKNHLSRVCSELPHLRTGYPLMMWFSAVQAPYLCLAPQTPNGQQQFERWMARIVHRGDTGWRGVLQPPESHPATIVHPTPTAQMLATLAAWVAEHIDVHPALSVLVGARLQAETDPEAAPIQADAVWAAMCQPSAARTAVVLARLEQGHRLWFWLPAPDAPTEPGLVVTSVSDDPMMRRLTQLSLTLPSAAEAGSRGTLAVLADGRLSLRGAGVSAAHLPALARWVLQHAAAHPALARLARCRLVRLDAAHRVTDIFEDDALWAGLTPPPIPGTEPHTAEALQGEAPLWFWMSANRLVVTDAANELGDFVATSCASEPGGEGLCGALRRRGSGPWVLLSPETHPAGPAWLQAHQQRHASLDGAVLAHTEGGRVQMVHTAPLRFQQGARLFFWVTDQGGSGPVVILDADADAVKAAARPHRRAMPQGAMCTHGRLRVTSSGVEVQARNPFDGWLAAVHAWARAEQARQPDIAALLSAVVRS